VAGEGVPFFQEAIRNMKSDQVFWLVIIHENIHRKHAHHGCMNFVAHICKALESIFTHLRTKISYSTSTASQPPTARASALSTRAPAAVAELWMLLRLVLVECPLPALPSTSLEAGTFCPRSFFLRAPHHLGSDQKFAKIRSEA
jgi:hypothetical protein